MRPMTLVTAAALAAAFLAAVASAEGGHRRGHIGPPQCVDPIPAERQANLLKNFGDKGIDADRDGALTCDEVKAFFQANRQLRPHPGGSPQCVDPIPADKQANLLKNFGDKGIDADEDGALTCDEVKAFFQANPQLRLHHGGPANNGKSCSPSAKRK